ELIPDQSVRLPVQPAAKQRKLNFLILQRSVRKQILRGFFYRHFRSSDKCGSLLLIGQVLLDFTHNKSSWRRSISVSICERSQDPSGTNCKDLRPIRSRKQ